MAGAQDIDYDNELIVSGSDGDTITYKAKWIKKEYEVKFYRNYENSDTNLVHEYRDYYNEPIQFPANPTRTGYIFLGWARTRDGEPLTEAQKTAAKVEAADVTGNENKNKYYAKWRLNTHKITFDYNDGSGTRIEVNVNNGEPILDQVPTPPTPSAGYAFKGWSESNDNDPSKIITFTNASPVATQNETYYAVILDDIAPIINSVTFTPPAENGWTNQDVVITVNATDEGSGIKEYSFNGGTTWITSNQKAYTSNTTNIRIVVRDYAGNTSEPHNCNINYIDKTPPTLQVSSNSGYIRVTTSDTQSGVNLSSFKIGNTNYTLTSNNCNINGEYFRNGTNVLQISDNVGNTYTLNFNYNKESLITTSNIYFDVKSVSFSPKAIGNNKYEIEVCLKSDVLDRMYSSYDYSLYVSNGSFTYESTTTGNINNSNNSLKIVFEAFVSSALGRFVSYELTITPKEDNGTTATKKIFLDFHCTVMYSAGDWDWQYALFDSDSNRLSSVYFHNETNYTRVDKISIIE